MVLRPLARVPPPPALDARSEQRRRERIAARVLEVQRQLDRRRERGRFALVLSLAALVAGLGAAVPLVRLFVQRDPAALAFDARESVQLVAGHASVRDASGAASLDPGQLQLAPDAVLVTPPEAGAELRLWSQAALSLAPATEVGIVRRGSARAVGVRAASFEERVRLQSGSVALRVPKLGRGKLSVQTGDALVEVHGTQFSVRVVERPPLAPYTEVVVREGRVLVRSGAQGEQRRFLGAGERWSSEASEASGVGAASGAPPGASGAPFASDPDTRAQRVKGSRHRGSAHRALVTPSTPSELAAQNQLLEDAEQARRSGLPLLATRHLDALIRRYPDAELAHNARVSRLRLLRQLGREEQAIEAAEEYLERYPEGFAREEARQVISSFSVSAP